MVMTAAPRPRSLNKRMVVFLRRKEKKQATNVCCVEIYDRAQSSHRSDQFSMARNQGPLILLLQDAHFLARVLKSIESPISAIAMQSRVGCASSGIVMSTQSFSWIEHREHPEFSTGNSCHSIH